MRIRRAGSLRSSETRTAWSAGYPLFISACGAEDEDGRESTFAHFQQEDGDLPTLRVLRVLGWDGGDTLLKFEHLQITLKERLHWPGAMEPLDAWRARWVRVFRHCVSHVINASDMLAESITWGEFLKKGERGRLARIFLFHKRAGCPASGIAAHTPGTRAKRKDHPRKALLAAALKGRTAVGTD